MAIISLRKKSGQKEKALLNAWLWKEHKTDVQWRNVRLGLAPSKEFAKAYSVILRYADAIFLKDGTVYIVEAKIRPKPDAIGQLEFYKGLFVQTPEFSAYQNWPIELIMLTTTLDLQMAEFASKKDISYIVVSEDEVNEIRNSLGQPQVTFEHK